MKDEELLAEVEDLLRTMPATATFGQVLDENYSWFGRLAAVIEAWDLLKVTMLKRSIQNVHEGNASRFDKGLTDIRVTLNQARHDLRMKTVGPTNVVVDQGRVFDYFDEIRKVVELATQDVFFIDPYLDAEFVAKYLGHAADGVAIRLLTKHKLDTLLPAVKAFAQQHEKPISVRSTEGIHDRYVFVDRESCYQSGASFKDGAKKAPTTLTQVTDAFEAMLTTYESMWDTATVEL